MIRTYARLAESISLLLCIITKFDWLTFLPLLQISLECASPRPVVQPSNQESRGILLHSAVVPLASFPITIRHSRLTIINVYCINLPYSFNSRLLELVEDCGPLPLANDKCKLDTEKTNKTAPFPYCCPKFSCEPGVKLEYPEIKAPEGAQDEKQN